MATTRCSPSSTAPSSSASARAARSSTSSPASDAPPGLHAVALIRARVVVSGRVQGVWFRDSCRREALARGVAGWANNRMDGTVECAFEGPAHAVAELVAWCRTGPPRAEVTGIDVVEEPVEGAVGFRIR